MEYLFLGNLMQSHLEAKLSSQETRTVVHQTLKAVAYLHNQQITHRDLKPGNILVRSRTPELYIKLCDFGVATDASALRTRCGTGPYIAAEIYRKQYSNTVDIWAIGVIALEFIKGLPTYNQKMKPQDWCEKIRCRLERIGQQVDDLIIPLLKRMLELKPENRPSAQACLADPLMKSLERCLQSGIESSVGATETLEAISEQPTEILDSQWRLEDAPEELNRPTTLEEPRKRARYSGSNSEAPEANMSLKKHCTRNYKILEFSRMSRKIDDEKSALKTPRQGLPRDHITSDQTGMKTIRRRTIPPAKPLPPTDEDIVSIAPSVACPKRKVHHSKNFTARSTQRKLSR